MVPLRSEEILHEGPLEVRANHGFVGLRRWLSRYFVICKKDWTLRRYRNANEVDAPTRPPRCYKLNDIDYVRADGAPRFIIKQYFTGSEGFVGVGGVDPNGADNTTVKLGADTSESMREFCIDACTFRHGALFFPFTNICCSGDHFSAQLPPLNNPLIFFLTAS